VYANRSIETVSLNVSIWSAALGELTFDYTIEFLETLEFDPRDVATSGPIQVFGETHVTPPLAHDTALTLA
jgi:hypothetical protein